jgi:hypothetical protein
MLPWIIAGIILYLSLAYACGRYTAKYATLRGRSKTFWFVLGALFYPFVVLSGARPALAHPSWTQRRPPQPHYEDGD